MQRYYFVIIFASVSVNIFILFAKKMGDKLR